MLTCRTFGAGYGSVRIVHDISFDIGSGECLALVGKNGMGKTTLLRGILGLADRHTGSVSVCDRDVTRWRTHDIVRLRLAYAPQDAAIFGDLTVDENLRLGALQIGDYRDSRRSVLELFPALATRLRQRAGTLSGGQRKMLILARAMLARPRLLLLDEVSEGLQPSLRALLTETLNAYRERNAAAILLVEQNLPFALAAADRFAVLSGGTIVESGAVSDAAAVAQIERYMTL
jgi:ABC-type branched-subunit amino acid transport system ATPase component